MDCLSTFRKIDDVQLFELSDHFSGVAVSGAIGTLGWTETASGNATSAVVAGGVNHPGVFRTVTANANGSSKTLHFGAAVSDPTFTPTLFERYRWVVRIPTTSAIAVRVGLMQSCSAADGGTAGAFFEFTQSESANWQMITRQASTSTITTAVAVVANNWYQLEAKRVASGSWEFWINDVRRAVHSANVPTTACNFGTFTGNTSAGVKNLDHDYCYIRTGLGQLYT